MRCKLYPLPIVGNEFALHFFRTFEDTEVIDLISGTHQHHLPKYADLPISFAGATGAFIKNKMLVCGGIKSASYCKKS